MSAVPDAPIAPEVAGDRAWRVAWARWDRDVVSLFEAQVERNPAGVALVDGERRVRYEELHAQAARWAGRLSARGVGPGTRVGLCLPRSRESVAAQLALLMNAAVAVPLDPIHPPERLGFILRDAGARLTLTTSALDARLRAVLQAPLDVEDLESEGGAAHAPRLRPAPWDAAHVMYTSGTSGAPKGIALPHAGVARLVHEASYIDLAPDDVVLHHATPGFDAATFEVWAALLNGGTLVIHRPALDLSALGALLAARRVTTLLLTTSVFHAVAERFTDALAPPLRHMVTGGEVLLAKAARRALERQPHLRLVNGYGPTENSVFTTCHVLTRDTPLGDEVPIGRAIAGTSVHVLDEDLRPVPSGEVGQLYTGGLGLGAGYLGREELTRRHFVASPFPASGPVLYRTGDLVRADEQGELRFVGRADRQVKVRGFRVEPGEVEHALGLSAGVAEAVVLAEDAAGGEERRLVACVRREPGGAPLDPSALRTELGTRLPPYMVPARIQVFDDFPLTPNGKVDQRRLRELAAASAQPQSTHAPEGQETASTQARVLAAFRRQLRTAIAPDASIYDQGASSLTVMVLQAELNETLGCALPPEALALAQTPAEWAQVYDRHRRDQTK